MSKTLKKLNFRKNGDFFLFLTAIFFMKLLPKVKLASILIVVAKKQDPVNKMSSFFLYSKVRVWQSLDVSIRRGT